MFASNLRFGGFFVKNCCRFYGSSKSFDIFHGEEVVVKKSKFIAHIARIDKEDEIEPVLSQLRKTHKIDKASHNITAHRFKDKETGQIITGRNDDGETGAGDKLVTLLSRADIVDVLVVIVRYYGGVKLGPDRVINNCAVLALRDLGLCK